MLEILKNDKIKDVERKKEVEKFLESMPNERFHVLVNLGKKITDYGGPAEHLTGPLDEDVDETVGVNVQFEESDEEGDGDLHGEIHEEEDDGDEVEEIDQEGQSVLRGASGVSCDFHTCDSILDFSNCNVYSSRERKQIPLQNCARKKDSERVISTHSGFRKSSTSTSMTRLITI